jgi:hypothetical protein
MKPIFIFENIINVVPQVGLPSHKRRRPFLNLKLQIIIFYLSIHDNNRKRQTEVVRKKKKIMIKNIHKLGQFPGIDIIFIIHQNKQYIIY